VSPGESVSHTRLLQEDMLARLEARIALQPSAVELQIERSHFLAELGRGKDAAQVYAAAHRIRPPKYPLTTRAYSVLPFRGKTLPITVLLLVSPEWGNAPFRQYLDNQTFLTLQVIAELHDPGLPLPPHHLVINAVSDADSCRASLEAAARIVAQSSAPCVNLPAATLATTREQNAKRLGTLDGVRTPRIATIYTGSFLPPRPCGRRDLLFRCSSARPVITPGNILSAWNRLKTCPRRSRRSPARRFPRSSSLMPAAVTA
jgi:hypothetical protein